jgi:hypothetical protein
MAVSARQAHLETELAQLDTEFEQLKGTGPSHKPRRQAIKARKEEIARFLESMDEETADIGTAVLGSSLAQHPAQDPAQARAERMQQTLAALSPTEREYLKQALAQRGSQIFNAAVSQGSDTAADGQAAGDRR